MMDLARLRSIMDDLYATIDRETGTLEAADPRFACPSPCSICCAANLFVVTGLEFLALALHAGEVLPDSVLQAVCARAEQQVRECPPEETLRLEQEGAGRERSALPCPLLEGGRCLVYPVRPVTCRLFGRSRFGSGAWNGCTTLRERVGAEVLAEARLPVVEDYSALLCSLLCAALPEEELEEAGALVGVSSLLGFISETGFVAERVASACRSLEE